MDEEQLKQMFPDSYDINEDAELINQELILIEE